MKEYSLDTTFTFGMHEGLTVRQVVESYGWNYIEWCAVHLDHFCMSEELLEVYTNEGPNRQDVVDLQEAALEELYGDDCYGEYWDDEPGGYDSFDYDRATFDALTDGQYGDYDDFSHGGGDMDSLRDWLGY